VAKPRTSLIRLFHTTLRRVDAHRSFSSSAASPRSDDDHCLALVRSRDYESYLVGLLQSQKACPSYFAVRALNVEVATVRDSLRSASTGAAGSLLAGRVRLRWWMDILDEIYSDSGVTDCTRHPVARALHRAVHECDLSRLPLEKLVSARMDGLDVEQHPAVQDLVRYAEDTAGSLCHLHVEGAGVHGHTDAAEAARLVGVAVGIVTAVRSAPQRAQKGEISVPADLAAYHGLTTRGLLEDPSTTVPALADLGNLARRHLEAARELSVPTECAPCLLGAVAAERYLDQLEASGWDAAHPSLQGVEGVDQSGRNLMVALKVGKEWMMGRF